MEIPSILLPPALAWSTNGGLLLLLALMWVRAGHAALGSLPGHLFLGSSTLLLVLWSIRTGITPGLNFHLLGASTLLLMFGFRVAFTSLCLVMLAITLNGWADWRALGTNLLLVGLLPLMLSQAMLVLARSYLPRHLFVYLLFNGFAVAALSMLILGLSVSGLLWGLGAYSWQFLVENYLVYFVLMAFSEGLLSGMAVTVMAVYRPSWLASFSEDDYLSHGAPGPGPGA